MRFVCVDIENYGPFRGKHSFQLTNRGLVLVLGDNQDELRMNNNGSGKTSLFDAVDWCLWGVVPKRDHADSIVHNRVEKGEGADVTVHLVDESELPIRIRRYRGIKKKNGVELVVGENDLTALDSRETQTLIERVLGMDREVYHASVYYAQEDKFNFADATDTERMDILTRVLQLESIDEYLDRAKEKVKTAEAYILGNKTRIASLEGELSGLNPESFDHQASQWEEERAQSLREATRQLNEHLDQIKAQQSTLAYEERCRTNLMVLEQAGNTVLDLSVFDYQISVARGGERTAEQKKAACAAEGKALRARFDKIKQTQVGNCSECGQPVTKEHLDVEAAKLEPQLEQLRVQFLELEKQVRDASARVKEAEEQRETQRRIHYEADQVNRDKLAEARNLMAQVEQAKAYVKNAEAHCAHLRGLMAKTQQKVNPWRQKQAEVVERKQQLEAERGQLLATIQQQEFDCEYLRYWVEGFGAKGLKSYILDSRLQEMTDAANEWVLLLTGGTMWVRFETQTQGRSTKKLSNRINLRVWRYNRDGTITEQGYRSWSGGEKQRVSWAVDFGLSRLVAARATKRYDMMILDEVFVHVDRAGGEAVVEMLQKLGTEKSSIFVIEQNADFQNHFEQTIVIRKDHGCSQIIEEESINGKGLQNNGPSSPQSVTPKRKKAAPRRKRVSAGTNRRKKRTSRSVRADQ
jgi:DNA repair exonuclease SbcCD ATPase subunit